MRAIGGNRRQTQSYNARRQGARHGLPWARILRTRRTDRGKDLALGRCLTPISQQSPTTSCCFNACRTRERLRPTDANRSPQSWTWALSLLQVLLLMQCILRREGSAHSASQVAKPAASIFSAATASIVSTAPSVGTRSGARLCRLRRRLAAGCGTLTRTKSGPTR